MDDDSPELVESISVVCSVGDVDEAELERKDDTMAELDIALQFLLVLEPLEMESEDVG
jgi:hypothetical protein